MLRTIAARIAPGVTKALTHDAQRLAVQPVTSSSFSSGTAQDLSPGVVELSTDAEYEAAMKDVADKDARAVVDFTATWCGPCKMIAPVYEQLSRDFPDVRFYKVDIDKDQVSSSVAASNVSAVPTFNFVRGGTVAAVLRGADRNQLKYNVEALRSETRSPP